jgi:hypothetical protein
VLSMLALLSSCLVASRATPPGPSLYVLVGFAGLPREAHLWFTSRDRAPPHQTKVVSRLNTLAVGSKTLASSLSASIVCISVLDCTCNPMHQTRSCRRACLTSLAERFCTVDQPDAPQRLSHMFCVKR